MYISRHAEQTVLQMAKQFGAVLVSGPRQVGKTTMLQNILKNTSYITMDDAVLRASASENPATFLKDFPPPLFIDEVQKVPQLFEPMKIMLDSKREKGMYFLSGSQQFHVMKHVSDSLAGRIGIVNLLGLSLREITGSSVLTPFVPTEDYFTERGLSSPDCHSGIYLADVLWRLCLHVCGKGYS